MKLTKLENKVLKSYADDLVRYIKFAQDESFKDELFIKDTIHNSLQALYKLAEKSLAKE